ncbi:hypothetical protein B0I00_2610 [Novosphingobium kunmingense]|uniref:Uncharacterized protein n=1 Tax=Novosphingobium kunmingense TaxID=1211806 RepID=A0A2N0H4X5_9SPHN|nr:hypothetical protein [Novosphingobium kunmingense]PKB13982.1 hypothetical protein B0I00_2610 [Novosphingobium kunmingense]
MMARHGFLLAGIAALAPVGLAAVPAATAREAEARRFDPPGKATITRTLYRFLSDGNAIVVTRRYDVTFVPVAEGFRLDGTLREALVDAPPELDALAEIERTRPDHAFPIMLDASGQILSQTKGPAVPRERHIAAAGAVADKAGLPEVRKREMLAQLATLTAAAGLGTMPADLFIARAGERRERRVLPLPDGSEGEIELAIKVDAALQGSLPERIEKTVTTRLAGSTRVSKEVWSLTAR